MFPKWAELQTEARMRQLRGQRTAQRPLQAPQPLLLTLVELVVVEMVMVVVEEPQIQSHQPHLWTQLLLPLSETLPLLETLSLWEMDRAQLLLVWYKP